MMIADNQMADTNAADATPVKPTPKRFRILVVDDNHDSALSQAMMLSIMGHETRTAHDGESAVRTAESFLPDVVLLDIGLPLLNGYEVAQKIRKIAELNHVKLVALTGYGAATDVSAAKNAGFDAHLIKPAELAHIQELLSHVPADDLD